MASRDPNQPIRLGVSLGYLPVAEVSDLTRVADEEGFDVVQLFDHVFVPGTISSPYPYKRTATPPFDTSADFPDIFVTMAHLAALTERIHFLSGVFVLPSRHPIHVAKAAGTVAVLSNNRIELAIGVGWMREEFEVVTQDFTTRGARTDEALAVIRALIGSQSAHFDGQYYRFPAITMTPRPTRQIPLYIGGESEAAHRRAIRFGDGMITLQHRIATVLATTTDMRRQLEAAGRDPDDFEFVTLPTDAAGPADFERLRAGGVTTAIAPLDLPRRPSARDRREAVRQFAKDVVRPLRGG